MLQITEWQPFKKYGITIYKKLSQNEYWALEAKRNGFGNVYNEIITKNRLEVAVRIEVENYIINNKLKPRKIDEEDIL